LPSPAPMNPSEFLDRALTQEDCDKMMPEYWEKTWYRRLYVQIRWTYAVRKARRMERKALKERLKHG
jgi:hypothetical protein